MYRWATSKKRAADVEKEIDTGDKEVQPAPEVEVIAGDTQGDQTDRPTPTENVVWQEMMRVMMDRFGWMEESNKKSIEKNDKNIESIKDDNQQISKNMETINKKKDDKSKKMEENMDCLLYTSRCV